MNGFSIIIPAHNEASVIEVTLRSILACKLDRALQIIVVANGCTDDTAAVARLPMETVAATSHALASPAASGRQAGADTDSGVSAMGSLENGANGRHESGPPERRTEEDGLPQSA